MLSAASLEVALPRRGGRSRARRRCCRRRPGSGRTRSRPCRWERRSPCPSRRARSRRPGPESRGEGARQSRRSIGWRLQATWTTAFKCHRGVSDSRNATRHRPSVASERVPCCRCPTQLTGWWVPAGSRRARSRTSTTTASTTLGIDKVPSAHAARIVPPTPWPGTRGPGSRPSDRRAIRTWCKPSTAVPSAIRHCRREPRDTQFGTGGGEPLCRFRGVPRGQLLEIGPSRRPAPTTRRRGVQPSAEPAREHRQAGDGGTRAQQARGRRQQR